MKKAINYSKIFLHGHRPDVHARFSKDGVSFEATIQRIKSLIKSGKKKNIIFNIDVHISNCLKASNYFRLNSILELAKKFGFRKIQFNLINPSHGNLIDSFDKVAFHISKARYVFLFDLLIKVKGLPYCLIPEPEGVISKSGDFNDFIKLEKCSNCVYNQRCDGILKGYLNNLDKAKIKPKTLPKEIMIEVTPQCNFQCQFCFNRASFAKRGYQGKLLTTTYLKKLINSIKKAGVPFIRFTGGEPLLRNDIFELIKYAKSKDLEVRMNTNASLIRNYRMARKMAQYLDYVLISMHVIDSGKEEAITGFKKSFERKIKVIEWLRKAGVKIIRTNTIATLENIKNLDKFYKLFRELGIDKWQLDRVMPNPGEKEIWGKKEISPLIEGLIKIKKDIVKNKFSLKVHIINALPFCAYDPVKINAVCSGARSVDGHERFVVDPRGFAKPIYYIEENIGNPLDIKACWNHPFMKFLRDYNNLPKECRKCAFLEKCKGGNRYCAYVFNGSYKSPDPLMDFSRVKNYNW